MAVTLLWRPESLVTILVARLLIVSILSFSLLVCGSQTTHPYSADDLTQARYLFTLLRTIFQITSHEVEADAGLLSDIVHMLLLFRFVAQCDTKIFGMLYFLKSHIRELI